MRRSWDEIRRQAKRFAEEWKDAHYEKGETQSFYNDFFEIFGVKRRQVASYEKRVESLDANRRGFIDLLWPGTLIIEQKSAGKDLYKADSQALDYFDWLPERDQPRYILTCDFQRWRLTDLESREVKTFTLAELPKHIELFHFVLGRRRTFGTQAAVNIKAAELLGRLHDALEKGGYTGHDLERLLVRLLFCLFADDTGIFEPKDIFLHLIDADTKEDGSDTGRVLVELFDILNAHESRRQSGLSAELKAFPYVNGELFAGHIRTPLFDTKMRAMLLDCARFDWGKVSPAIFGSLFQSVMDAKARRAKGAHYTSETNIMKVIGPLFLDDLRAEFVKLEARRSGRHGALIAFQHKLANLRFLDPACGCGNFLVIAYRELRRLELDCLKALYGDQQIDAALLSRVTVDQFYGIELEEFPAEIAKVAMWMTDHIANNDINEAFRLNYARIPLKDSAHILNGDALEADWNALLPATKCDYVLGNPPFGGQSYQTPDQREQMARVLARPDGRAGSLDYVAAWFLKAGEYVSSNRRIRIGFVATNSITQGEQVAQLWPILFDRYRLEIAFAHRTFQWDSEARGKAHVHVVIIGLAHRDAEPAEKRLFSYADIRGEPDETRHEALTAYLFDARAVANRYLVLKDRSLPISIEAPTMRMGSKLVEGGQYIFGPSERRQFLEEEPRAESFLVPLIGSQEYIRGESRWILALQDASPSELRAMPKVLARVQAVRAYRAASKKEATRKLADFPLSFEVTTIPDAPFLVIPKVSSERRDYVPFGWLEPPMLPSDLVQIILNPTLWHFAILTSAMHMAWLRHIGGRLKSDYRYTIGLVYNTFSWPHASASQRLKIEALAQAVLDARIAHPTSSLADLYDPDTMPGNLRRAHNALDAAVDKLYRAKPFASDRDRVEHLFGLYEAMIAPLEYQGAKVNRRVARRAAKDSLKS